MKKKEFIKELYDKRNGITGDQLKCLIERKFPELVKKSGPFKNGDIIKFGTGGNIILRVIDSDTGEGMALNSVAEMNKACWSFKSSPFLWEKVDVSVWKERLIEECKKRGIWDTPYFTPIYYEVTLDDTLGAVYDENVDELWSKYGIVYRQGVFATQIETISKEEAEKQLGKKIV